MAGWQNVINLGCIVFISAVFRRSYADKKAIEAQMLKDAEEFAKRKYGYNYSQAIMEFEEDYKKIQVRREQVRA